MYFYPDKKGSNFSPAPGASAKGGAGKKKEPAKKQEEKKADAKPEPAKEEAKDSGSGDAKAEASEPEAAEAKGDAAEAKADEKPGATDGAAEAKGAEKPEEKAETKEEAPADEAKEEPAPAGEEEPEPEKNERWAYYRAAVNRVSGGSFSEKVFEFNVIGVLGYLDKEPVENKPDEFNDTVALAWKDDKGNEKCLEFKASLDAGGRENGKKEIHLWTGQYRFKKSKVTDASGSYDGFVPAGKVKVFIDTNGDGRFHPEDPVKDGSFPQVLFGAASGAAKDVAPGGQYLAGGRAKGSAWDQFTTELAKGKGGFLYTLVDGTWLEDPVGEVKPPTETASSEPKAEPTPKSTPTTTTAGKANCDDPPKLVGNVPMAPSTGILWPVVPQKGRKPDKTVFYQGEKKKHGWAGGRHFGAPRTDGGPRHHAGIDLVGSLGDLVVACEPGEIIAWYHFYRGVYALLVQNDSGTVINYGEVDERSKKKFGWKIGDHVETGQEIAIVGKMIRSSMLHFEMFTQGTKRNAHWKKKPDKELLNPTQYLLDLAAGT